MEAFVQMTGYVGGEVTYRNNSVPIADFRLASTPRMQRGTEWANGETTWITVKAFRSLAEHIANSVHRGDPVIVIGKLRTTVWARDGVTYERLELDATTIGHDLRRGTSSFRRAVRPSAGEDEAEAEADDSPSSVDQADAPRADRATGPGDAADRGASDRGVPDRGGSDRAGTEAA
jgi:single-strand DNA-binding protein